MGESRRASLTATLIAVLVVVEVILSIGFIASCWPALLQLNGPSQPPAASVSVGVWWSVPWFTDLESLLIATAAAAGALGSCVHALTSLSSYVGNQTFQASWTLWYLIRLPIGAALALVLYFVLRGGLINTQSSAGVINPYAVVAISALAGMFSKQATDKLEEIFSTLFRTANGGDSLRDDKLVD